jgi:hypothetical protein
MMLTARISELRLRLFGSFFPLSISSTKFDGKFISLLNLIVITPLSSTEIVRLKGTTSIISCWSRSSRELYPVKPPVTSVSKEVPSFSVLASSLPFSTLVFVVVFDVVELEPDSPDSEISTSSSGQSGRSDSSSPSPSPSASSTSTSSLSYKVRFFSLLRQSEDSSVLSSTTGSMYSIGKLN